jgi:hypothetical protein
MSESKGAFEPPKLTKRSVKTHPLYSRWQSMTRRCRDPHDDSWPWYGQRGIKVCARWRRSFPHFVADMGFPPTPKHSLHRIDRDGDYEPKNVRWVDPKTRQRLRRGTTPVSHVRFMKMLHACGWTPAQVARFVDRPYATVYSVVSGRAWTDVQPMQPFRPPYGRQPENQL